MFGIGDVQKNRTRNIRVLLVISIFFWILVVISAWFFHVYSGRSRILLPFISETNTDYIEGTISKVGFTLVGLTYPIIGWHIFQSKKMEIKISNCGKNKLLLNKLALAVCIFQAMNIIIIAFLPWSEYPIPHAIFANFVFTGGLIWALLYHKLNNDIDYALENKRTNHNLRSNLFVVWFIGIGLMIVGFFSAIMQNKNLLNTLEFDTVRTEMLIAAIGEWIMFFASMAVFYTFYEDILDLEND